MFKKYEKCPRIKGVPVIDYVKKLAKLLCGNKDIEKRKIGTDLMFICVRLREVDFNVNRLEKEDRSLFLQALEYACEKLDMDAERIKTDRHDRFQRNFDAAKAAVEIPSSGGCNEAHQRLRQTKQRSHRHHQKVGVQRTVVLFIIGEPK
jgi:hypothetical protein